MNISTYDFAKRDFDSWEFENDYHAAYILENGTHAYIGESSNVRNRAARHKANKTKKQYKLKNMHVITDEDFDGSSVKHYERILIKLMRADSKFVILNDNDGQKNTLYKRKNDFERKFDKFWPELVKKGLVNQKEFNFILNSSSYKYSPYTEINSEQSAALNSIVNALTSEETRAYQPRFAERPILVDGDAGAGKTVVATSLFYYLKSNRSFQDKKIAFVIPNSSMRHEIREIFKSVKGLSKKDVMSPADITKEKYDIIICDEAHKLRNMKNQFTYIRSFKAACDRIGLDHTSCDELDWIFNQGKSFVLFYDKKQSVSPSELNTAYFEQRIHDRYRGSRPVELKRQQRIKAGRGYVRYIYDILYQKTKQPKQFKNYEFALFSSFGVMYDRLFEKNRKFGLSRLCSGYPWKHISKKDDSLYDIVIEGISIKWNQKTAGWVSNPDHEREMGSIYTLAGLDLNYAGVVIGPDIYFDKRDSKIKVNTDNFFDNKVKKGVNAEAVKEYVLNTYAVLLTRAIEGTYVYVCDNALREYLSDFIEQG
jgi:DUF2075 family protein/predicted GIY-YIG superfamily endonuclease